MPLPESASRITPQMLEDKARELAGRWGNKRYMQTTGDTVHVKTGRSIMHLGGRKTEIVVADPKIDTPHAGTIYPTHGIHIVSFPFARYVKPSVKETHTFLTPVIGGELIPWRDTFNTSRDSGDTEPEYRPDLSEYYEILDNRIITEEPSDNLEKKTTRKRQRESTRGFRYQADRLTTIDAQNKDNQKSYFVIGDYVGSVSSFTSHFENGGKKAIVTVSNNTFVKNYLVSHRSSADDDWKTYKCDLTNRKILVEVQEPDKKMRKFRLATEFEFKQLMDDLSSFEFKDIK
jgi:hypothetical protein